MVIMKMIIVYFYDSGYALRCRGHEAGVGEMPTVRGLLLVETGFGVRTLGAGGGGLGFRV